MFAFFLSSSHQSLICVFNTLTPPRRLITPITMEASMLMLSYAEPMRRKVNLQVHSDTVSVAPKVRIRIRLIC